MADPKAQAARQLSNIEEATGKSVSEFVDEVAQLGLAKHGEILAHFKDEHGLGHGNANLLAHVVRERLEGGPVSSDDLLDAQYAGAKQKLRPIYQELSTMAESLGDDVDKVIQKTGVSFRRAKQFALIQAPSSNRVQLGLNLEETPADERVSEVRGMCSHRVDITEIDQVDDSIASWLRSAYECAS